MHRFLRRFCIRSPAALRRAQLFCDRCSHRSSIEPLTSNSRNRSPGWLAGSSWLEDRAVYTDQWLPHSFFPSLLVGVVLFWERCSCASTCWLLGCVLAETTCSTYAPTAAADGGGRTFAEIYAGSSISHPALKPAGSTTGAEATAAAANLSTGGLHEGDSAGRLELWTLVELIEHGLGGATADIAGPDSFGFAHGGPRGLASCNGPMVAALTGGDELAGAAFVGHGQGAGGTTVTTAAASWVTLAPLLVPSVLLPLLFAAIRCDAFTGGADGGGGGSAQSKGLLPWCQGRGPSGLPRGVVVGGFQLLFVTGTQGALVLGSRHPTVSLRAFFLLQTQGNSRVHMLTHPAGSHCDQEWAAVPIPPHLLQLAALATLLLHCAMVCSDPDPVDHHQQQQQQQQPGGQRYGMDEEDEDPVEALLREDRKRRAYAASAAGVATTASTHSLEADQVGKLGQAAPHHQAALKPVRMLHARRINAVCCHST